jgi:3-hydroxyacyl-[acyl-carrier protein] dehydratase/trans-2-decenoyl-[acyl-carrier protein] isomerase
MIKKSSYTKRELLQHAWGVLPGQCDRSARLPAPPFLMFDRITAISDDGGAHGRGSLLAEKDVVFDEWFFLCHFRGDPVMPGCLGLDALWQLGGFYLAWVGCRGRGRALGCAEVTFEGEVRPHHRLITYELSVKRVIREPTATIVADGYVSVDGKRIYECRSLKVGTFELEYVYPAPEGA